MSASLHPPLPPMPRRLTSAEEALAYKAVYRQQIVYDIDATLVRVYPPARHAPDQSFIVADDATNLPLGHLYRVAAGWEAHPVRKRGARGAPPQVGPHASIKAALRAVLSPPPPAQVPV